MTSDVAQFEYKCTDLYVPEDEISIAWNDPQLAIAWPDPAPLLSDKDRQAKTLAEHGDALPRFVPDASTA